MKIARVIETFLPNITGPVNQAFTLSCTLEKRNIHSPVFTTYYNVNNVPAEEFISLVSVQRLQQFRVLQYCYSPGLRNALQASNREEKIDIIHAHTYRSYQTAVAFQFAKKHAIPFVLSTHGSLLGYDNYLKNKIVKFPYKCYDFVTAKKAALQADAVVVNSQQEYQEALRFGIAPEKLHLIPVGIAVGLYDRKRFQQNELLKMREMRETQRLKGKEKVILLFVARISRNRNLELLIRAMPSLKEMAQAKGKVIELHIVGKEIVNSATDKQGYLAEMRVLACSLGVAEMITFFGEQRGDALIKHYLAADIFVYTSLSENFGQPLLEAAAAGLPIVSPAIGIAPALVVDDKTGYLVAYDAKDIAAKIALLLDKKKRVLFGKNLRVIVRKNYSWATIIDKYIRLYKLLVKKSFL